MQGAREGNIGVVQESQESKASEILDQAASGSNLFNVGDPTSRKRLPETEQEPVQREVQPQQPVAPQGIVRQEQRQMQQEPVRTGDNLVAGKRESIQEEASRVAQVDQVSERKLPNVRDLTNVDQDVYPTVPRDIPSYDRRSTQPVATVDLVSRGEPDRVTMDQTRETILNERNKRDLLTEEEKKTVEPAKPVVRKAIGEKPVESAPDIDPSATMATDIDMAAERRGDNVVSDSDVGWNDVFYEPNYVDLSSIPFQKAIDEEQEAVKTLVSNKGWDGNAFTEKAIASRPEDPIDPIDVSIGTSIIREIVREPGNMLIDIVNKATGMNFTVEQVLTYDGMILFAEVVNNSHIDVVAVKSPVVGPSDTQRRRLRIHDGRGIKVHPTQTKIYNLDFDGDGVSIEFDVYDGIKNAMKYLINADGQAMIDTDFFPISVISTNESDYVSYFKEMFLVKLQESARKSGFEIDITSLARAMYHVSNPKKNPGESDDACLNRVWCDALREMQKLANKFSNPDVAMSSILRDVYDNMLTEHQYDIMNISESIEEDALGFDEIDAMQFPEEELIRKVAKDMSRGILPPNFQDFVTGLNQYIGEIEGKNVMFRLGAKYAKIINFNKDTYVANEGAFEYNEEDGSFTFKGSDGAWELYKLTLKAGETMFMNGRYTIGEKTLYMQKLAKQKVFDEVGFPSNYRKANGSIDVQAFLKKFRSAWNREMRFIECSNFGGFSCDMDKNPDPDVRKYYIDSEDLKSFRDPLIQVYGNQTIEVLFPFVTFTPDVKDGYHYYYDKESRSVMMLEAYRTKTLSEMSMDNRIMVPLNVYSKKIGDAKITDLLLIFADKRTSRASEYNKSLNKLLVDFKKCFSVLHDSYDKRFENPVDFEISMNEMMAALHLSGPSMFRYFGMQDPNSFVNSRFGKMISKVVKRHKQDRFSSESKAIDEIGGIRATMVFEYRMRKIDELNKQIDELLNSDELVGYAFTSDPDFMFVSDIDKRINALQNRLLNEFAAIESSSDLWRVIVAEIRDGNNSAFQELLRTKGECLGKYSDENDEKGHRFWKDEKLNSKYNSLTEVMADPDVPKSMKEKIAVDVVRQHTGFMFVKAYEINYQLEIEADASNTSLTLMAYREQPSVITDITEAHNAVNRFFKRNWDAVVKDVKKARRISEQGELNSYVQMLAENPEAFIEVPNDFIADAIEAQMDKTSRAGEKAHQEIQVDGYYNAKMMQIGGVTDSMYRYDARTLGLMPLNMLSAYDVIKILADPTFTLTVYDGSTRKPLSREILCGSNSEEDLWNMLENNPRIASLLRPAVVSSNMKGTAVFRSAKMSFSEGFELGKKATNIETFVGRTKAHLTDKPMFLAMVSMFVPIHGKSSRSVRSSHSRMIDAIQKIIVRQAYESSNGNVVDVSYILEQMGVTVESIMKVGFDKDVAKNWYDSLSKYLGKYIREIGDIMSDYGFSKKELALIMSSYENADVDLDFDKQSITLAMDNNQTFSGAKTETSTGVEGCITRDNLGTGLYASAAKGRHEVIDGDMTREELVPFIGCMTNVKRDDGSFYTIVEDQGSPSGTNVEELEDKLDNDVPLIVQGPDGWQKQDETLDDSGNQITTLGRVVTLKRGKGAEDGNLKVKRSGYDGTDSITKTVRYSDFNKNIGLVMRAYEDAPLDKNGGTSQKYFAAKLALAEILKKGDNAEGYDDMDLSDYMDVADVMIKEVSLDDDELLIGETQKSTIVIRGIGEISAAIRRNMDRGVIDNGTANDIVKNATEIADEVGLSVSLKTEADTNAALSIVSTIQPTPTIGKFRPMKKPSESSFERNYFALKELSEAQTITLPWSGKRFSTKAYSPFSQARLNVISKGHRDKKTGKWIPGVMQALESGMQFEKWDKKGDNFYCPINVTKSKKKKDASITTNISPGPQSVWVLEEGADEADIKKALTLCYSYGMTLAFTTTDALGSVKDVFIDDVTPAPFDSRYMMLPFFNIRANGGAIMPPMAPANYDEDPSWYSLMLEDGDNYYGLGDSDLLTDKETVKSIQCSASRVEQIKISDLFYNVLHCEEKDPVTGLRVCDLAHDFKIASWDDVKRYIVDYVDDGPAFDLGISVANPHSDDVIKKFGLQIQEYRDRFYLANSQGILPSARPDRIIGWMTCSIGNDPRPVFAPIIAFPTGTSSNAPTQFTIDTLTTQDGNTSNTIDLAWSVSESMEGQVAKVFDETNAAGKTATILSSNTNLGSLRNGRRINWAKARATDKSRKLGTERLKGTLQTLALIMKFDYGFNFAEVDNSFPDNPDIRQELQRGYISKERWIEIDKEMQGKRYHTEPDVDALLHELVHRAVESGTTNPTDLLANKFGNEVYYRYVDYDFFFRTEPEFQNALMHFYNLMNNKICPPSIDSYDPSVGYLFKPVDDPNRGFDYGCLQLLVPLPSPDGSGTIYRWNNCYLAMHFMNDEYTGMRKPGLNGSNRTMEQYNAMAISGQMITGKDMRLFAQNAASPTYKNYSGYEVHLDYGRFLSKER